MEWGRLIYVWCILSHKTNFIHSCSDFFRTIFRRYRSVGVESAYMIKIKAILWWRKAKKLNDFNCFLDFVSRVRLRCFQDKDYWRLIDLRSLKCNESFLKAFNHFSIISWIYIKTNQKSGIWVEIAELNLDSLIIYKSGWITIQLSGFWWIFDSKAFCLSKAYRKLTDILTHFRNNYFLFQNQ